MQNDNIAIKKLHGLEIEPLLMELAQLRIQVFREYPYLYDGDIDYEKKYLKTYLHTKESIALLACNQRGDVVGASTGIPLMNETNEFIHAFQASDYNPSEIFYCAESILLPDYRGKGIYKKFFLERENQAKQLGRFQWCSFCCVEREDQHPLKPKNHIPLDKIWQHFGYEKRSKITTSYKWKDIDKKEETQHKMVFWIKNIIA